MPDSSSAINEQYGKEDLIGRIFSALADAGKDLDNLSFDDLSGFDQLHFAGREATRTLAHLAKLKSGSKVLDIGSGIGGPARTLAADFNCQVVGIDITEEYVNAAEILTDRLGLSGQVTFRQGSALDLPFEDESFDVVWTQNALMNIEDKRGAFSEAHRVLRPEKTLALEALMAGPEEGLQFPVFWADSPELNYLSSPAEYREMLADIGFAETGWKDVTLEAIAVDPAARPPRPEKVPSLGIGVIYDDVPEKGANVMKGLKGGQILNIYAVERRSA